MKCVDNCIGVDPCGKLSFSPLRSKWGGWERVQEYKEAYEMHAPEAGFSKLFGAYHGASDAVRILEKAIAAEPPSLPTHPQPHGSRPCVSRMSELQGDEKVPLLAANEELCVWGPGSGAWMPTGGCMSKGEWPGNFGRPHHANIAFAGKLDLLPLVVKDSKKEERDQKVIDALVLDQLAAGMAVFWERDQGLPTVVSNLHVVHGPSLRKRKRQSNPAQATDGG